MPVATSEMVLAVDAAFSVTRCTPEYTESAALSLSALAISPKLKFMPLRVASVIFCTSSAWMVAPSAREFCSSQKCTALSSSIRFSSSSTLRVGATQLLRLGIWGMLVDAPLARFCRKSKPGTNLPKPDVSGLLIGAPKECSYVLCCAARSTVLLLGRFFEQNRQCLCSAIGIAVLTGTFNSVLLSTPLASLKTSVSGIVVSFCNGVFRSISMRW